MSETLKTKEYSMFKLYTCNRPIMESHVRQLMFSIKTQNMLSFRPILVDSEMNVIDGQHRLEAAKRLQVDIHYQINKQASHKDIVTINASQKNWALIDYIKYYAENGNPEYKKLLDFMKKNDLNLSTTINLIGQRGGSDNKRIRSGNFIFSSASNAHEYSENLLKLKDILDLLYRYILSNNQFLRSSRCHSGIINMVSREDVDLEIFKNKISIKSESIKPCASSRDYYQMLKNIYNWKNQNPIE